MTAPLHILMIAPQAPPKNTPEAIQVRHLLHQLDRHVTGRLVTTAATNQAGWVRTDHSLEMPLEHFDVQELALPLHRLAMRILLSHRMKYFHVPDPQFWITCMARSVVDSLARKPTILYSRSSPMSAAILACKVKRSLNIPWIMHLSDPWADSPDAPASPRNARYEAQCFAQADKISLTTEGQAAHYRQKYPAAAHKIFISPNMMAGDTKREQTSTPTSGDKLHLVYAGALYSKRSPTPFIQALSLLRTTHPELMSRLTLDVYGNAQDSVLEQLRAEPDIITYHGPVSFSDAIARQREADVVLTLDVDGPSPLYKSFLPSKVIECVSLGKPMLAITPDQSETARICEEGYGWAVAPSQPAQLATTLAKLITGLDEVRATTPKSPPQRYAASTVCATLLKQMQSLVSEKGQR